MVAVSADAVLLAMADSSPRVQMVRVEPVSATQWHMYHPSDPRSVAAVLPLASHAGIVSAAVAGSMTELLAGLADPLPLVLPGKWGRHMYPNRTVLWFAATPGKHLSIETLVAAWDAALECECGTTGSNSLTDVNFRPVPEPGSDSCVERRHASQTCAADRAQYSKLLPHAGADAGSENDSPSEVEEDKDNDPHDDSDGSTESDLEDDLDDELVEEDSSPRS